MTTKPEDIDLTTRLRTLSEDFSSKQQSLQKVVESNEEMISQQSKLINQLTREQRELSDRNQLLAKEVAKLNSSSFEGNFERIAAQNIELHQKVNDLELILAKTKVESATKEEQILLVQLQLNRLSSNSQKQLEVDRIMKGPGALSKSKIVRIVQNGKISRTNSIQGKQIYSDAEVKQWIKYLQLRESSQQATVIRVKDKCKSIIKHFIPNELRRLAWPLLIQNKLSLTPALYSHFLELDTSPKVKNQIQKDIQRWFTIQTQKNETFIHDLQEILEVFHCYRPDISYVQGMTYPAGILLMVLDKYKAWQCCCNILLTNQVVYNLYTFNLEKIALYCRTFDYLLSQSYDKMTERLEQLVIHSQIYLIEWFYTLFSRSFSLPTVFKIWDLIVFHGECILFRVSLAIFQQLKYQVQKLDYDECIQTIKSFNLKVDQNRLLQQVVDSRLTTEKLRGVFSKVEQLTQSRAEID